MNLSRKKIINNYMTVVERSYSYAIENEKFDLNLLLTNTYTHSSVIATNQHSYKITKYSIRIANSVIKFLEENKIILALITKSKNKKIYIVTKHLDILVKQ